MVAPAKPSAPTMNALEIITNAMLSRSQLIKKYMDSRRDIPEECGYPVLEELDVADYKRMYDVEAIAARVVEVFARESWQVQPEVYEVEDGDTATPFEEAWDTLGKDLRGGSLYQDEEGSPIWEILRRADELSGIGRFGILLLGLDDKKTLDEPAEGIDLKTGLPVDEAVVTNKRSKKKRRRVYNRAKQFRKLVYLRAFDESLVKIAKLEEDPASRRFGQPVMYEVTFANPNGYAVSSSLTSQTKKVHWTRVIHLADNLGSSEILGMPRMQQVYRNLLNLIKLYGGSAEMYWRGAFPGLSLETHPNINPEDFENSAQTLEKMKEQVFDYAQGLDRVISLMGMSAKSLAPQVVDPTQQIAAQIEAICIKLGCPIRVFKGSERGELASTQDDSSWNDRLGDRQRMHNTARIIVPFVDRLIAVGVLPRPEGFSCKWPDLNSISDQDKAEIASKRVEAMSKFVGGNCVTIMSEFDFWTREMGYTDEEAEEIVLNAQERQDEITEDNIAKDEEGLNPDGTVKEEPLPQVDPATGEVIDPAAAPIPASAKKVKPGKKVPAKAVA